MLRAQSRKFRLTADVSLEGVERALPNPCTGADIGAVVSGAFARALEHCIARLETSARNNADTTAGSSLDVAGGSQTISRYINSLEDSDPLLTVAVSQDDFLGAAASIKPSVTAAELLHYDNLAKTLASKF